MAETEQLDVREETPDRKKAVLAALEDKYGIVTDACRISGVERSTFYHWLKNDPEFKAAVDEIQEVAIDYVESKLFERINGVEVFKGIDKETGEMITYSLPPDVPAISLYLKTRGKKRGYIERTEHTGADGKDLNYTVTLDIGGTNNNITTIQESESRPGNQESLPGI